MYIPWPGTTGQSLTLVGATIQAGIPRHTNHITGKKPINHCNQWAISDSHVST